MEVSGKHYRLTHPSVPDELIDEEEFDRDERLPYWAEIWPSAIALARRLSREDLAGRRLIELGVGVGLPTLVALDRGASVLATDYYAAAPDFTRHNALKNGVPEPETALLDWHAAPNVGAFDLVIAADVMYEERSTRSLARLVPGLLEADGEALLADPGRRYEPLFRELMQENGFGFETEETSVGVEGLERDVTVLLHSVRRL
ncbi:MAG TPA: methyltransferase domain-containing protein [Rubrobacter sp.]|nr:methyltransferase domain-containing protein [Rubrobacter sp.]